MNRRSFILGLLATTGLAACGNGDSMSGVLLPYTKQTKAYGPHTRQSLDVYTPKSGVTSATKVVVFFFGGGFQQGNKGDYEGVADTLVRAGHIVVVPNYRLWSRDNPTVHQWPTQILDGASVVAWCRANLKISTGASRPVYLVGHSAGGIIAAHLTLDESYIPNPVMGTVGMAGGYNLTVLNRPDLLPETFFPPGYEDSRNATSHATGSEPPMFLLEGLADEIDYPTEQTKLLETVMVQAGCVVEAKYYPGIDHAGLVYALAKGSPRPEVQADVLAWLAAH